MPAARSTLKILSERGRRTWFASLATRGNGIWLSGPPGSRVCTFDRIPGALQWDNPETLNERIVHVPRRFQEDLCGLFQSTLDNWRSPMPN
jgi:hypothetical protein